MPAAVESQIVPEPRSAAPWWAALVFSAGGGYLAETAFPDRGWWPMILVGVVLGLTALRGRGFWSGAGLGLVWGGAFWLPHIDWLTLFLGPVPWIALVVLMSLWAALAGGAIALAYRLVPRAFPGRAARLLFLPVVVAGLWTLKEALQSTVPYGGFGWGRLAESLSASPFVPLFSWLGISGVSFVVAFLAALALEAIAPVAAGPPVDSVVGPVARASVAVGAAAAVLLVPAFPVVETGALTVAAVQGNGKTSYFDPPERVGDNLRSQYTATAPVFDADVDLVVWPEGSSDLSPLDSAFAAAVFDDVADRTGAPFIAGAITERDGRFYNSSLLWQPGSGLAGIYDKRHPIPFAEYIPDRDFWYPLAPELLGQIGRDYTPGTRSTVLDTGATRVGVNICFDIADDGVLTDSVDDGAELIVAQTNNADFGLTDESYQQLAIARIRAAELGRAVVNVSTVGASAVIRPDGSIQAEVPRYRPEVMIERVPTSDTVTPAVLVGRGIEQLAGGIGLAGLLVAAITSRRRAPRA